MKKYLALIFALLFIPSIVHATVLLTESWESGWNGWEHPYGGASIVSGGRTGNALMFTIRSGGGNSPDIVAKHFTASAETYGQFYMKVSANYEWPDISDKWFFLWGPNTNACLLSMWGNKFDFTSQTDPNFTLYGSGSAAALPKNTWVKVNYHAISQPTNGTIEVWINDAKIISSTSVPWGDGAPFNQVAFEVVFGGNVRTNYPYYVWYDDLTVQTTPFGSAGTLPPPPSPAPSPKTPGFPSNLLIN